MVKILFTEPAEYDLVDIEYYIHVHLRNPRAAERIVDGILNRIEAVADHPMGCPLVQDELLRNLGVRIASFENYHIFYIYDRAANAVSIVRVLYARMDWKTLLTHEIM